MSIVSAAPEIGRDHWGRPLVTPPGGGKPVAYQRCTSYIDVLEDKYNLQKWMQRMVALGLASRPDLLLSVSAHRDDKRQLDRICEDAREAAAASAAATTGTALHALTELIDRGHDLPAGLPANAVASLEAYKVATADLKATHIEQFVVQDALKVGGTPDRIVRYDSGVYIADIKTGSIDWGALKIAQQLAIYARSQTYDIPTGERSPHGADLRYGLIIHLPAVDDPAEAKCDLWWTDLEAGWQAVQVSKQVREQRKRKFNDLVRPFEQTTPGVVSIGRQADLDNRAHLRAEAVAERLEERIKACPTAADVRELWDAHQGDWTDALTQAAKRHIAELSTVA